MTNVEKVFQRLKAEGKIKIAKEVATSKEAPHSRAAAIKSKKILYVLCR